VVTAENLKAEIVDKEINGKPIEPASVLCTGPYVEGCKKLGLTP
jgi:D-xylose transport system substrate-binding protein